MEEKKPYTIKYITKEQYEEVMIKGSTVIDGETVSYGDNLSDKDSNDMFDETVIDTLKEMAVKHSNDSYVYRVLVNAINLIHRLQDDNKRLTEHVEKCLDEIDRLKTANAKQQAEIERLTEKTKSQLVLNQTIQTLNEKILAENAELQQQVADLKERAKIDLENEKNWGKIQTKQAVKDTAKEILAMFGDRNYITENELKEAIAKRYGLEVE